MKLKRNIFFLSLICGLLFIGMAIPLLNEMVEPNDFFGLRIPESQKSPEDWYRINKIGAWALMAAGAFMMIATSFLYFLGKGLTKNKYTIIFLVLFLASIFLASGISTLYI